MFFSRFLGKRSSNTSLDKDNLEAEVEGAQRGDADARNRLLQQYSPFISQVASKVCKKYINPLQDDEFSVALEAFDEAITKYSKAKGSSFLSFADLVIRRRIIDYIRKEARHRGNLSLEYTVEGEEDTERSPIESQVSLEQYRIDYESAMRREEIQHYKDKLKEYDIEFAELPEQSPKHADARMNAISVAAKVVRDPELKESFLRRKKLPMKELMKQVEVSRKTVERNRTYIVAVILVLIEDYRYLQSYINIDLERGSRFEKRHSDGVNKHLDGGVNF